MRNKRLFERIVRKSQKELKEWLAITLKEYGYTKQINKDGYLYLPGEIPVMLIAHMDTVHTNNVKTVCWSKDYDMAMSPEGIGGDDRSGVYMILRIVKNLKCHILFCEDEEKGCVGATKFTESGLNPLVNYLVEFDRMGHNDAVFYSCDNKDFTKMVLSYDFEEEYGSYSDISTLAPYLKLAAVNISSGYYNAHTKHEYVVMGIMNRNADRVARMIAETYGTKYEYVPGYRSYGGYHSFGGGWRSYYSGRGYGSLYGGYDDDGFYYGSTKGEDEDYDDSTYQKDQTTPMRLSPLDRIGGKWVCSTATDTWEIGKDTAGEYALSRQGDLYIRQYENTWSYLETPFEVLDSTGNAIHFSINDYIWAKVDDAPEAEEKQTELQDLMGEELDEDEDIQMESVPLCGSTVRLMVLPDGLTVDDGCGGFWCTSDSEAHAIDEIGNYFKQNENGVWDWFSIYACCTRDYDDSRIKYDDSKAIEATIGKGRKVVKEAVT